MARATKKAELAKSEEQTGGLALPSEMQSFFDEVGGGKENLDYVTNPFFVISIRNSRFKIEKQPIGDKGLSFQGHIMHIIPVNAYYKEAFDSDNPTPPDCASVGGVAPDSQSEDPQATMCAKCEHMKWGTGIGRDGSPSRGKACKQSKRLVIHVPGVELPCLLNLPPTSHKYLDKFLKELSTITKGGIPAFAAVTEFFFPDEAEWPIVQLRIVDVVQDVAFARELHAMRQESAYLNARDAYADVREQEDLQRGEEADEGSDDGRF